jgi:hypothetical protein
MTDLTLRIARLTAQEILEAPPAEKTTRPDARDIFARLTRAVRDNLALESRIAAGILPEAPREAPPAHVMSDPRREPISAFIHDAIEDSTLPKPTRAALHDRVEPILDDCLASDPEITRVGGELAAAICGHLGIPYKTARMPDELLVHPGQSIPSAHSERPAGQSKGHDPP